MADWREIIRKKKYARFLEIAHQIALISKEKQRLGAVLVKRGKIVGVGCNERNGSKLVRGNYPWPIRHAEISAISSVEPAVRNGSTIFVCRVYRKNDMPALARPCQRCRITLYQLGVKRVIYTISEPPYFEEENL